MFFVLVYYRQHEVFNEMDLDAGNQFPCKVSFANIKNFLDLLSSQSIALSHCHFDTVKQPTTITESEISNLGNRIHVPSSCQVVDFSFPIVNLIIVKVRGNDTIKFGLSSPNDDDTS